LSGGPGLTVVELFPQDGFRYASGKKSTAAPREPSTMLTYHIQRAFVFYNNWYFLQSGVIPAQGYKGGYSSISEPVGGQAIFWTPMISCITAGVTLQVNDMWKADCCSFAFFGLSILAAVIQPVIQGCYGGEEKTEAFSGK
jgi:hypothetical protein